MQCTGHGSCASASAGWMEPRPQALVIRRRAWYPPLIIINFLLGGAWIWPIRAMQHLNNYSI